MSEPKIEVQRISWNWYRYRVVSPPDVDVMGVGTLAYVKAQVRDALIRAGASK